MSEIVDAIVAELIVRDVDQYERDFNRATAAHDKFFASTGKLKTQTFDLAAEGQKYKAGADRIAQGEEQLTQRVTRTRKKRADDAVAQDEREVVSAKKAAKAKADAAAEAARRAAAAEKSFYAAGPKIFEAKAKEIKARNDAAAAATAEARTTAAAAKAAADAEVAAATRIKAAVDRGVNNKTVARGSGANLGRTVPREGSAQASIPNASLNAGAAEAVAAEAEINHLMADQAILADRLRNTRGKERDAIREQIGELRLIKQLQSAGLADEEIALKLEQRRALIEAERVKTTRASLLGGAGKFAEGAGLKRTGGGTAAIAGIAAAVGVGVGIEVIQSAVEYGKALDNLSKQLGITVEDLQAYQKIARDVGVTQEQLSSAFGQFASNLGRAQQNEQEQAKIFKALGVNIKEFASAGDALPTVIDRISQIKDPAQRAAVETRLFGEEGRKLDALLSGGAERVSELSRALQETGRALSAKEIQELDQTARKLSEVKNQLSVDFARVVAGNADAIIGLANSFATLANRIFGAIGMLQRFHEMSNASGADLLRMGQAATPEGRASLLRQNEQKQDAIRAQLNGGKAQGRVVINGQDVTNAPDITRARNAGLRNELRQLANEHRDLRTGGNAAPAATPTPAVQAGTYNPSALRNLGTPAGPKGKSAEQAAREAEQREKQFNDQLAQAQADFLRAQEQMTGSVERRAEIEAQLLKTAYEARVKDIDTQASRNKLAGADAKLEDARAAELKAAEKKAFDAQSSAIEQDKQLDINRALTQKQQTLLDVQQALLGSQLAIAQTAAERGRIELALLANSKEQERNRLNGIIASAKPGDPAAADAQAQLGSLDQRFEAQRRTTEFANRGPLKTYLDALPRTADQVNEALENAAAQGMQSLNDGLTDAVKKFLHLEGIAGDFLGKLIEIGIQRELLIPLANELFPTGTGGGSNGGGGLLGSLAGLFGGGGGSGDSASSGLASLGMLLGGTRAAGGNVVAGVPYLVGEKGAEPVVFGASGKVYPNGALPSIAGGGAGGMNLHQSIHIDASGVNPAGYTASILGIVRKETLSAIRASGQAVLNATPARMQKLENLGS